MDELKKHVNNAISKVFRTSVADFNKASEWFKDKDKKLEFFNSAAQRYTKKIEEEHGLIRLFGIPDPIPLRRGYIQTHVCEKNIASQRQKSGNLTNSNKRDANIPLEAKPGLEIMDKMQKVIVLGKSGAGKTSFFHSLCLDIAEGKLEKSRIPIFIGLRDYSDSEKTLTESIVNQFSVCRFPEADLYVEWILHRGKCLLLFDGLDEVSGRKVEELVIDICNFSDRYSDNQFVLNCKSSAYNYHFENFTEVEIVDLGDEQIKNFISKWFNKDDKYEQCWAKICDYKPIKEMASNPLLLSMLCFTFNETNDFPPTQPDLYKETFDVMLKKWNTNKSIKRDQIYRRLPLRMKESIFSRIAVDTFEKDQLYFSHSTFKKYISDFMQHVVETQEGSLEQDSEVSLKTIANQHAIIFERAKGLYSFFHPTFLEFFTTKYIINNTEKGKLEQLVVDQFTDTKWREIFLLIAGMIEQADNFFLLMKQKTDAIVDKRLLKFLKVIQSDIVKKEASYSPIVCKTIAILYILAVDIARLRDRDRRFNLDLNRILDSSREHARALKRVSDIARNIDFDRERAGALDQALYSVHELAQALDLDIDRAIYRLRDLARALDRYLTHVLKQVRDVDRAFARALDQRSDQERVRKLGNAIDNMRDLSRVLTRVRDLDRDKDRNFDRNLDFKFDLDKILDLGHIRNIDRTHGRIREMNRDLELDYDCIESLGAYLQASKLLVDCLQTKCYVSKQIRQKILNELLTVV